MGVVMVVRFKGVDRERFGEAHERVAAKVNELARDMGATHHDVYYSPSLGEAVVIDEWPSREVAERFWATDTFRSALAESGVGPPDEVYALEPIEGDPAYRF
jgi:hypothetical protein